MKARKTTVLQSPDELMAHHAESARIYYSRSKNGIIFALAHAHFVCRTVENNSNAATQLDDEIARRNSKIDGYNNHQRDDRERAQKLAAGKLADKDLDNDERVRLKALAALSDDEWQVKYRKIAIDPPSDANTRSRIVKHLFALESRADAPNASRYTTALHWVHDNCPTAKDAADIVTAVKNAGGLDKVIDLQRLARKTPEGVSGPAEADAIDADKPASKPKQSNVRSSWNRADVITSAKIKLDAQPNDLVLLLGRYRKGKVEIVKAAPVSDHQLDSLVDLFGMPPAGPQRKALRRRNRPSPRRKVRPAAARAA